MERSLTGIGIDGTLRWDGGWQMADVQVPILGIVATAVDWRGVDGDLELTFAAFGGDHVAGAGDRVPRAGGRRAGRHHRRRRDRRRLLGLRYRRRVPLTGRSR